MLASSYDVSTIYKYYIINDYLRIKQNTYAMCLEDACSYVSLECIIHISMYYMDT